MDGMGWIGGTPFIYPHQPSHHPASVPIRTGINLVNTSIRRIRTPIPTTNTHRVQTVEIRIPPGLSDDIPDQMFRLRFLTAFVSVVLDIPIRTFDSASIVFLIALWPWRSRWSCCLVRSSTSAAVGIQGCPTATFGGYQPRGGHRLI